MSEQEVKELDLNGEMLVRREKLAALRAKGNAFPNQFRRDSLAQDYMISTKPKMVKY